MHRIGSDERRARLGLRHHLARAARVDTPLEATRGMVCLHATDPATVHLSARARQRKPTSGALERALYDDRTLVRMLAMRRTMFVVAADEAPVLHWAASVDIARGERRRNLELSRLLGVEDPPAWIAAVEADTVAALDRRGEATAQELTADVPALAAKVRVNQGKAYVGDIGFSSRVLLQLALDGLVVRGRPRGTWISSQYRWAPMARWLGRPMPELATPVARAMLVRRWLDRFGPGTLADLRWWTGWTAREVRAALVEVGAIEIELDDGVGYVAPGDTEQTPAPDPWVALLPALDPTTMGWQARDWYLGGHRAPLFDTNGNAGPTIWADGRIVGGWAVREGGEVVTRLLEDIGSEGVAAVEVETARLTAWLAGTRVVPRFPTPLHRELVR